MRTAMMLAGFLTGAIAMSDAAVANGTVEPQKKDKPTEKVTLRQWLPKQGKFVKPTENVDAFRKTIREMETIVLVGQRAALGGGPTPKSEITDKDGVVYVVDKVSGGGGQFICYVTKKEEPKK